MPQDPQEKRSLDELLAAEEAYYYDEFLFGTELEESHEAWLKWQNFARLRSRLKAGEDVVQEAREALGLGETDA